MQHREITWVAGLYTINCQQRHKKTLTELNNVAIMFKKATNHKQKMNVASQCTQTAAQGWLHCDANYRTLTNKHSSGEIRTAQ
jgi:hypothetical protein